MSSTQFTEFLEQVRKEAKPGEIAMAVIRFADDSTTCHGFGAPITPFANSKEVIGTVKSDISEVKKKRLGYDSISTIASIFSKAYVEDERNNEWIDFAETSMNLIFAETDLTYSQGAKLNIVRVDNKDALTCDRFNKGMEFSTRLFGVRSAEGEPRIFRVFPLRREASDEEYKSMRGKPEITVYLGTEAILDDLVSEKDPFKLAKLFDALSIPLTEELQSKAQEKAMKEVREFYKLYISSYFQDQECTEREERLLKAAKSNGGDGYVHEDDRTMYIDDETDVRSKMYDQRVSLGKAQKRLFEKTALLTQMNVTRFVDKEMEIQPHIKINIAEMLKGVSEFIKVKEEASRLQKETKKVAVA